MPLISHGLVTKLFRKLTISSVQLLKLDSPAPALVVSNFNSANAALATVNSIFYLEDVSHG